jgi:hypothetical protein
MTPRATSLAPSVADVSVFFQALFAGVVDTDNDQWLDCAGSDQFLGSLVDTPLLMCECCCRVEEVLTVVHIQNGIALAWMLVVSRRQIDEQIASVLEELRWELGVKPEVPG